VEANLSKYDESVQESPDVDAEVDEDGVAIEDSAKIRSESERTDELDVAVDDVMGTALLVVVADGGS